MKKLLITLLLFSTIHFTHSQCSGTTKTWNGTNWSPNVPTINDPVKINNLYKTADNGNLEACTLTVKNNKLFVITEGNYVKIKNNIINNGTIRVFPKASLVQVNNTATITSTTGGVYLTRIKTTTLQDSDRFTYFSSPTNSGDISNFSAFALENWEHDDSIQNWSYLGDGTAIGAMTVGKGYAVRAGSGAIEKVDFSDEFNNGIITIPLAFDVYNNVAGNYINPGTSNDDSNLVGNPYPSAIDADVLIANNDISGVYIWTHESAIAAIPTAQNPYIDNDYIECVIGVCTNVNNIGGNTASTHNGFIASGQGFFVVATAATNLIFNNAMRVTGNNDQFKNTDTNQKLWLNMTTKQGYNKQIALTFTENGTANYDVKYESKSFAKNFGLDFYSYNAVADKLSINDTGLLTSDRTIPLGLTINSPIIDGATISIDHSQNLEDTNVYLIDNLLNVRHDLKRSDYQITVTETGEVNDRFEIVFNRSPLSTNDAIITNDTLVVSNQNTTQIKVNILDGSVITNFKVFDVLGKLVIDMKPNKNNFVIDTNFKPGQVLFIKATLENGQVLSNKFMKL